ncbi:eCIS core domain-containing protein [Halopiger djelfimassiliensis]|uniref:eCIS core domain-containing protein n=1 Tax=Halopiger djelfimassiliensis TaxID=1293047 RepID=UPI000AAAE02B|nr:DUF4157 domain-containing protein [Halopiger djelfimassiliensis]
MTNRPTHIWNTLAGTPSPVPDPIDGNGLLSPGSIFRPPIKHRIQSALKGADTTANEVPQQVLDVIGSGGMPLHSGLQRTLEERMDADFSNVRIHTGAKAAEAAESIDAKAFTCGNDIVFNSGEYDPESAEGQFLLAHELAHVRQQTGAAISMMPKSDADLEIDPDPQLEREADRAAEDALSGGEPLTVNRLGTEVHIQRSMRGAISSTVSALFGGDEVSASDLQGIDPDALETETRTDHESLVDRVEALENNQQQLYESLYGDEELSMGSVLAEGAENAAVLTAMSTITTGGMMMAEMASGPLLPLLGLTAAGGFAVHSWKQLFKDGGGDLLDSIDDLASLDNLPAQLQDLIVDGTETSGKNTKF